MTGTEMPDGNAIDEYLWSRYNEIYRVASCLAKPEIMLIATDRQAELLGVTFGSTYEEGEDDE